MRAILENVAGVDVHKEMLALTVLRAKSDGSTECIQFGAKTFTEDLLACGAKLLELGVKHVAMGSTGVYWKPIHNVWSPIGIELTVAQAAHVKQVPGSACSKEKVAVANRIARAVYKVLAGNKYRETAYRRALDHEVKIKRLVNQLKALAIEIKHEGHQKIMSSKKQVVINETGVQLA